MAISDDLLEQAVGVIACITNVRMKPADLVDDVVLMAYVWPDEHEFKRAVTAVCRAFGQLERGEVEGAPLRRRYQGWRSYHFQHRRAQGCPADMRAVYRRGDTLDVLGFGHRWLPADIYRRLAATRDEAVA